MLKSLFCRLEAFFGAVLCLCFNKRGEGLEVELGRGHFPHDVAESGRGPTEGAKKEAEPGAIGEIATELGEEFSEICSGGSLEAGSQFQSGRFGGAGGVAFNGFTEEK